MVKTNSLVDSCYAVIAAALRDVQYAHGCIFSTAALQLTLDKVRNRVDREGMGFLTVSLPRLGKALDKALLGVSPLDVSSLGFETLRGSSLPRFLGELFQRVFRIDGTILPDPCVKCVRSLRQIAYLFYKYELPYTDEQKHAVIQKFERTEEDLTTAETAWSNLDHAVQARYGDFFSPNQATDQVDVARAAQGLLIELFADFDPQDIRPRHGPGAVSTRETPWGKYMWTNVAERITDVYPLDAYFMASVGHVCDAYNSLAELSNEERSARVVLVPKDSRGPRLISCEPVDFQWVQQGLGRAIVQHVENHELTKFNVFFTDQAPNQRGALLGSKYGGYATLDLNEASDRVSLSLVRLLFPARLRAYMESCRSLSTELPSKRILQLRKFAPMGSALCFPVLALTVWAILTAAAPDADTREGILVYGDDVIVPTAFAENAIEQLESFGLKINRDKSCTTGFFRESCGTDAFKGVDVTPVRLRTVWSASPSPDVYCSWIAYANSFYDRQYYHMYDLIVQGLHRVYGEIPSDDMHLACPSLRLVSRDMRPKRRRVNHDEQRLEWFVRCPVSPSSIRVLDGWSMLLRYFAESGPSIDLPDGSVETTFEDIDSRRPFRVSQYTNRRSSILARRWR